MQRRRATEEQDALRRQIVAAVRALHAAGGYAAVTMRSVAAAVELAPMSLYRYFPNKAALLDGVWEEVLGEALAAARGADAAVAPTDDPCRRLRAYYRGYVEFWLARPDAYRMVFDVRPQPDGRLFAGGHAGDFRREAEALIDACLPDSLDAELRHAAHALCRCKVLGYLFLAIRMHQKGRTGLPRLLDAVLDDIERQLHDVPRPNGDHADRAAQPAKGRPATRAARRRAA